VYCSDECRDAARAPAVYRFVSPDGRSYVGGVKDCRNRAKGLQRSNARLLAAFEQHPPETFVYEVLEHLPPRSSERELREAEQRHIDRLRSWSPETGFNIHPAIWEGDGPAQCAGRQVRAAIIAIVHEKQRRWTAEWRRQADTAAA
jgi:hypothetical protein